MVENEAGRKPSDWVNGTKKNTRNALPHILLIQVGYESCISTMTATSTHNTIFIRCYSFMLSNSTLSKGFCQETLF